MMLVTNSGICFCLNGIISITAIPLREKKQKTLPRADGCGLNSFDGMLIHCLMKSLTICLYHLLTRSTLYRLNLIVLFVLTKSFILGFPGCEKSLCLVFILLWYYRVYLWLLDFDGLTGKSMILYCLSHIYNCRLISLKSLINFLKLLNERCYQCY